MQYMEYMIAGIYNMIIDECEKISRWSYETTPVRTLCNSQRYQWAVSCLGPRIQYLGT